MSDQLTENSAALIEGLKVMLRPDFEKWCKSEITDKEGWIDARLHAFSLSCFTTAYRAGFLAAVEMVRDKEDRYGIGSMCSQWRAEDVAEDMLERASVFGQTTGEPT